MRKLTFNAKTDVRGFRGDETYAIRTTRGGDYGNVTTVYHIPCGTIIFRFSAGNSSGYSYGFMFAERAWAQHMCESGSHET